MEEILDFLAKTDEGATEEQILQAFPHLKRSEIISSITRLHHSAQAEVVVMNGKPHYRALINKTGNYEEMVLSQLAQSGTNGMWLRDIKMRTNIPHNLILKILKNLEGTRKIKAVKSVKNNRKIYILYDLTPAEEITGGVWFSNGDVDLVFVNKLLDIIYRFCVRDEDENTLLAMEALPKMADVHDFIVKSAISGVELSPGDISVLVDCLVYDGRMEKYHVGENVHLRCLK